MARKARGVGPLTLALGGLLFLAIACERSRHEPTGDPPAARADDNATRPEGSVPDATSPEEATDEAEVLDLVDVFVRPAGPRGLELSERVRALDGRRVRVRGYVVRQELPTDGRFLLTTRPMQLHEEEYGLADDLPAATLVVLAEGSTFGANPPRGPVVVAGTLRVGNREEPDGRVSALRLTLDRPVTDVTGVPVARGFTKEEERS